MNNKSQDFYSAKVVMIWILDMYLQMNLRWGG